MNTLDITVLVVFVVMAGVGVASHPRSHATAADWTGRIGLIGAAAWLCWMFFRPGGESARGVLQTFQNFFSQ
jgi:hypothetical protein